MRLLLMGAPGSGKGTQAAVIATRYGIPAISTGDIFRANVTERTPLGIKAQRHMDAGDYVPDDVTNAMVAERLAAPDCRTGFVLDGYPRTTDQVTALDATLARACWDLDAVIVLTADIAELIKRLTDRAQILGRTDDTEDVIRRRQEVYLAQTEPLIAEYKARGIAVSVDGLGAVEDVTARIYDELATSLEWTGRGRSSPRKSTPHS